MPILYRFWVVTIYWSKICVFAVFTHPTFVWSHRNWVYWEQGYEGCYQKAKVPGLHGTGSETVVQNSCFHCWQFLYYVSPALTPRTLAVLSPHVSADRPALGRGYLRTCAVRYVPSSSASSSSSFFLVVWFPIVWLILNKASSVLIWYWYQLL